MKILGASYWSFLPLALVTTAKKICAKQHEPLPAGGLMIIAGAMSFVQKITITAPRHFLANVAI